MLKLDFLKGSWLSIGYDWVLEFSVNNYKYYDAVDKWLILKEEGNHEQFHISFDRITKHNENEFSLYHSGDISRYHFKRIDALNTQYTAINQGSDDEPTLNYEILCSIFAHHYAFFKLRNIHWHQVCQESQNKVTSATTQEELLSIFKQMLLPLADGHVSLDAVFDNILILQHQELRESIKQTFKMPSSSISPRSSIDAISSKIIKTIIAPYQKHLKGIKTACNGILNWCELEPGIGYLNILRLFGFANTQAAKNANDLPHEIRDVATFLNNDLIALNIALDTIMDDFQSVKTVILDIRINGGGFDRAAMVISNRFAEAKHLAFKKKTVIDNELKNGFTDYQNFFVYPDGDLRFTKPVYLMTSCLTLSAGEIFTFCMNALPNVTSVGENTHGMLSDNLNKHLPNGWELSLSNEIYESPEGLCYEGIGIPPNIEINTMNKNKFLPTYQQALVTTVDIARQHLLKG